MGYYEPSLGELKKFVETDEVSESRLRQFAARLARSEYERLGWSTHPDESETDSKMRAIILSTMLYGEDKNVIDEALKLYRTQTLEEMNPELRPLILSAAVRYSGDSTIVTELMRQYQTTQSSELKDDIASGVTSSRDDSTHSEIFTLIKNESIIRRQDVTHWFVWLMRNRYSRERSWHWLQTNWAWIELTFGGDKSYDDFPRYAASCLVTREQLEEYKSFFGPMQDEPGLLRAISVGKREIEGRVELIERDSAAVREALLKN